MAKIRAKSTIVQPDNDHVELIFDSTDGQPDDVDMLYPDYNQDSQVEASITTEVKNGKEDAVKSGQDQLSLEAGDTQLEPVGRRNRTWPDISNNALPRLSSRVSFRHVSQSSQSISPCRRSGSQANLITQRNVDSRRPASGDLVRVNHTYG